MWNTVYVLITYILVIHYNLYRTIQRQYMDIRGTRAIFVWPPFANYGLAPPLLYARFSFNAFRLQEVVKPLYTFLYSNRTIQYNSYTIRSQSVLSTNSTGHMLSSAQHRSEIASITCLHNFSRPALLSCSEILTYQLLGNQLQIVLSMENSKPPATAINRGVSKSRHNSRTKLHIQISSSTCIASFRAHRSACTAKLNRRND